ncbi:hypothetical protein [Salimicrobium flavidum]|uniref:Uncharacterized protein n=1 Tax=Salimicrobium flavidum TaxID=570947 RepID=A0A1N7KTE4_9BACI|nr:hypothetical protein [Salimicrobium flavidum]SIS64825.1 hypothetical protein SAMN05421687_1184 [Salimicrobium flavidum]
MKVISLDDYREKDGLNGELRKDEYGYEYCFAEGYEEWYDHFRCEAVEIGDVFANMLEFGKKRTFVSILFSKEWTVPEVVNWLRTYTIHVGESPAQGMVEFEEVLSYRGIPVILGEKGRGTLEFDAGVLDEITDYYEHHHVIRNSANYEEVEWPEKDDALDVEYPGVADDE